MEQPLNHFMQQLMAQELPVLDSASRARVMKVLKEYDGPVITSQDELPAEIREILEL
ncbi:hypothetical protein V6D40_09185 [Corynebacterium sp. Q4381]|uniref:hypothetical protein n=1 Tax=Corynebacterium sp. Marseille-Q4381 TaxID=3121597 RepID=UPI002FE57C89